MHIYARKGLPLIAVVCSLTTGFSAAQDWADNFDRYPAGAPVDPGGTGSIGNNWESWSSGLGSSTVADSADVVANSGPNSLANNPGSYTVNNFNRQASHPDSGQWSFCGMVYHPADFVGQSYWLLLNTHAFGGPHSWSVQVYFSGDGDFVDCDCAGMNDPAGPAQLVRDSWVPFRAEIDLDADIVDVFYNSSSLTGGQTYSWTEGVFGNSLGVLEVEALALVPWDPHTTTSYYDDLSLTQEPCPLGTSDLDCVVVPNSSGFPAELDLAGTGAAGDAVLATVRQGPPGEAGYFISGPAPGAYFVPPSSAGLLCIGRPQFRYTSPSTQMFVFDASGTSGAMVGGGPSVLPTDGSFEPVPAVLAGETRVFQAWFHDGSSSNFSQSRVVTFGS